MALFFGRLKLTNPMVGRITYFLNMKSPKDMEFAKWSRICENTCELLGFHKCSTHELTANISLLNYMNVGVRKFIW